MNRSTNSIAMRYDCELNEEAVQIATTSRTNMREFSPFSVALDTKFPTRRNGFVK